MVCWFVGDYLKLGLLLWVRISIGGSLFEVSSVRFVLV